MAFAILGDNARKSRALELRIGFGYGQKLGRKAVVDRGNSRDDR